MLCKTDEEQNGAILSSCPGMGSTDFGAAAATGRFHQETVNLQNCCFTWQSFFMSPLEIPLIHELPL